METTEITTEEISVKTGENEKLAIKLVKEATKQKSNKHQIKSNQIMTKDELIQKQTMLIVKLSEQIEKDKQNHEYQLETVKALKSKFYSIGQPLNDNILKFNKEQLMWCASVHNLIEQI